MSTEKTVLIIEDTKAIARALEHKLSAAGYEVTVAKDGQEGLKKIKENSPNLVILDLMLPGMDGFSVLEKIADDGIEVFIFSELTQNEDKDRAEKLGASKFFVKSEVDLQELVVAVEKSLS